MSRQVKFAELYGAPFYYISAGLARSFSHGDVSIMFKLEGQTDIKQTKYLHRIAENKAHKQETA